MADSLAKSTALLEQLLIEISKQTDPVKCDELAAEIRRVLDERKLLKQVSERPGIRSEL